MKKCSFGTTAFAFDDVLHFPSASSHGQIFLISKTVAIKITWNVLTTLAMTVFACYRSEKLFDETSSPLATEHSTEQQDPSCSLSPASPYSFFP